MMLGPMKKKMITTGVVAFLIPTITLGTAFGIYSSMKKKEIDALSAQALATKMYVFSGDLPVNHIVTKEDIKLVDVKVASAPEGAFTAKESGDLIGKKLRIAAQDKTIPIETMFFTEDDNIEIDIRSKEFNMITVPSDLRKGDYIDIRILFPTGEDYLVVAGKEIIKVGTTTDSNSIFLNTTEEELVKLSGAIIESYISNSIKLYAVKYVKPEPQLFHDEHVDYVAKYEGAVDKIFSVYEEFEKTGIIKHEDLHIVFGESGELMEGDFVVEKKEEPIINNNIDISGDNVSGDDISGDLIDNEPTYEMAEKEEELPFEIPTTEADLDIKKIAELAEISEEDAELIRKARAQNDTILLGKYKNKSITVWTPLEENYPVRKEVAQLIASNPNIVDELKEKYNIEELEQERENLIDTSLKKYNIETGLIEEDESVKSAIADKLATEIQEQKTERKEYLQELLRKGGSIN